MQMNLPGSAMGACKRAELAGIVTHSVIDATASWAGAPPSRNARVEAGTRVAAMSWALTTPRRARLAARLARRAAMRSPRSTPSRGDWPFVENRTSFMEAASRAKCVAIIALAGPGGNRATPTGGAVGGRGSAGYGHVDCCTNDRADFSVCLALAQPRPWQAPGRRPVARPWRGSRRRSLRPVCPAHPPGRPTPGDPRRSRATVWRDARPRRGRHRRDDRAAVDGQAHVEPAA